MYRRLFLSAVLAAITLSLAFLVKREHFAVLLVHYGAFFGVYLWIAFHEPEDATWYIRLGFVLRVLLVFSLPELSDDFYRFVWDGRLLVAGYHPFAHPPEYYIQHQLLPPGSADELFSRLNSPEYHTVYPPLAQAVFGLGAGLFKSSIAGHVLVIRLFLLACEWGTLRLLRQRQNGRREVPAVLYALNPLAILEIVGNCHFEGAMIFFLLWGIRALERGHILYAATGWSLAIASKLLPFLFLPLAWRWLGWRNGARWVLLTGMITGLLFLPLFDWDVLRNIAGSLNLYFRQFAFNASVYYMAKAAFQPFAGAGFDVGRTIGPWLGMLTLILVTGVAMFRLRQNDSGIRLAEALTLTATLYLLNATTVHPWYILVPFALSLGTRWYFPLAWTGVAVFSYSHYADGAFRENYGWIALEYGIVAATALIQSLLPSPTK